MKLNTSLILILILAASAILFLFASQKQMSSELPPIRINPDNAGTQQWETKVDDQPPVSIKITPIELGKDADTWKFQVTFDTHSGSLDNDLLTIMSLADNTGREYQSISWDGTGPGGHHREGILVFKAMNPPPPFVELKIKNVGGIPERSFKWDIIKR